MNIDIIGFITNNLWLIVVTLLVVIFIIILIDNRKALKKKIKNETISFAAMVFSMGIALISFISKPSISQGTLSLFEGGKTWFFPLTGFFILLTIITTIYFFRKELAKEI